MAGLLVIWQRKLLHNQKMNQNQIIMGKIEKDKIMKSGSFVIHVSSDG
ncbi:hypothetical protein [Candidatus Brocadia sapporoensis]|nr:hypothetical protein [Candidatus Brocadia sapporoensis]